MHFQIPSANLIAPSYPCERAIVRPDSIELVFTNDQQRHAAHAALVAADFEAYIERPEPDRILILHFPARDLVFL